MHTECYKASSDVKKQMKVLKSRRRC